MEKHKASKDIESFLNFLSQCQREYKFCYDEMTKQESLTQDYLHSLELDGLKCSERSKIATKLMENRQERRAFKDRVEELEPIITFAETANNVKFLRALSEVLGEVRKRESRHENRTYTPRVLTKV